MKYFPDKNFPRKFYKVAHHEFFEVTTLVKSPYSNRPIVSLRKTERVVFNRSSIFRGTGK